MKQKNLIQRLCIAIAFFCLPLLINAQVPEMGSQIGLRGDKAEVDKTFKLFAENNMKVARIWITFNPFRPESWDFSRYDWAFEAAQKYGVRLCPTLGPVGSGVCVMPSDAKQLEGGAEYIKAIVMRYKDHPALDTWMLINEPGKAATNTPFAMQRYREWLKNKYGSTDKMWGNYKSFDEVEFQPSWNTGEPFAQFIDWHTFWRENLAWYLNWIASEIRKWDTKTPTHANPHGLISNLAGSSYDLPTWRTFLTSIGSSMHPTWHFGFLKRNQFALGASYQCDLLRGSFEPKPFWVTELQGGNNLYRDPRPFNPTYDDIAQFLWTIVGAGGKRVIYWTFEPNEGFSLVDYQGKPSERLQSTSDVEKILLANKDFFETAKPIESPITIILSLETMTLNMAMEGWFQTPEKDFTSRTRNAHLADLLGFYKTFTESGIPVNIKHINDYDWEKKTDSPRLAIFADVIGMTQAQAEAVSKFVQNGNTALITGGTGIYNEYRMFTPIRKFPLAEVVGGNLKENQFVDVTFNTKLTQPALTIPTSAWRGTIDNKSGEVLGKFGTEVIATRNKFGQGQSIWIPSIIGVPAWENSNDQLLALLKAYVGNFMNSPFSFEKKADLCVLRTMENNGHYVTVVTNGSDQPRQVVMKTSKLQLKPTMIWGKAAQVNGKNINLGPRETVVMLWK